MSSIRQKVLFKPIYSTTDNGPVTSPTEESEFGSKNALFLNKDFQICWQISFDRYY